MQGAGANVVLPLLVGAASLSPMTSLRLAVRWPDQAHLCSLAMLSQLRSLEFAGLSDDLPIEARPEHLSPALPISFMCTQLRKHMSVSSAVIQVIRAYGRHSAIVHNQSASTTVAVGLFDSNTHGIQVGIANEQHVHFRLTVTLILTLTV